MALLVRCYSATKRGREVFDKMVLMVPGVRLFVLRGIGFHFLQSLAMVLQGGMRLVPALRIASHGVSNSVVKQSIDQLINDVSSGLSLSSASMRCYEGLFSGDVIALMRVGQETGNLGALIKKASDLYKVKIERSLSFVSTVFQPLLMIILGLLVALLIFAVYVPILSLSSAI
jgi:type II secretory pathway component PulF